MDAHPKAFVWCMHRVLMNRSRQTQFKSWGFYTVARAGIYVSQKKKGSKVQALEPMMLEAYSGIVSELDNLFPSESEKPLWLKGDNLKFKQMNAAKNCLTPPPVEGDLLWRKYKEYKAWYINIFLVIWRSCLNNKGLGEGLRAELPSGTTLEDILTLVLQKLWENEQSKKQTKKKKSSPVPVPTQLLPVVLLPVLPLPCVAPIPVTAVSPLPCDAGDTTVLTVEEQCGSEESKSESISSTMPDWWLPNEFLACCAFGAPSGDEEASWRLDVGAAPKPNARNISSALSILPLTPNQGVFGRVKQRSEEQERSKILQGKAIRLRNKERQR